MGGLIRVPPVTFRGVDPVHAEGLLSARVVSYLGDGYYKVASSVFTRRVRKVHASQIRRVEAQGPLKTSSQEHQR